MVASSGKTVDAKIQEAALLLEYAFGYGVDFKNRVLTLSGDVSESMFDIVQMAMTELESQSKAAITVRINSPGGEVYQALAIVGRLKRSKCHIVTEGYGHIMSAATLILACGDKRLISEYAFFMHHESSYAIEGKHSEVKSEVKHMEREEQVWAELMEKFTSKPKKFWLTTGVGTNAYFVASELLELGVVDEVF